MNSIEEDIAEFICALDNSSRGLTAMIRRIDWKNKEDLSILGTVIETNKKLLGFGFDLIFNKIADIACSLESKEKGE